MSGMDCAEINGWLCRSFDDAGGMTRETRKLKTARQTLALFRTLCGGATERLGISKSGQAISPVVIGHRLFRC